MDYKVKSYYFAAFLTITASIVCAKDISSYEVSPVSTELLLSYENLHRDDGNPNLGLLGTNINFNVYKDLYLGPSIYSAVGGDLGGLFVIGGNVGLKHHLYQNLWIDTGYFAGGGGGQNVSNNPSGFMSQSHIGLTYDFRYFQLGIAYIDVNYPDYTINDQQWMLTFSIPGTLLVGSPAYQGDHLNTLDNVYSSRGISLYRSFIGLYQENYFLRNSKNTAGDTLDDTMQLAGAKGGIFLNPNLYFGLSTGGAYSSSQNGYMDFYALLGYQKYFTPRFFYIAEMDIGAGGGGATDTGTGLIYKGSLGLGYALTPSLALLLEGGYLTAPNGSFEGPFSSLGIYYQFFNAGPLNFISDEGNGEYTFAGWSMSGQNETYIHPQRSSTSRATEDINLAVIEMTHAINSYVLIKGQAASAYGGNAGSYATGMIGPAVQSSLWHGFRLISDVLVGAAGGGAIEVGQGAVYQPEAGISFDVTPYISLVAKTGRIIAMDGGLNAETYNAGIVFNFTTLQEGMN